MKKHTGYSSGFTLVELAIVLVIIGLIVGGVLVGRDMIRAAEVRATVAQLEKYKAAINTFRSKYACLPGDCATAASRFGMQTRTGADGHGDGDGRIEACTPAVSWYSQSCETTLFWRDLSFANLIDGSFNTATDAAAAITVANQPLYFPEAKLGKGNFIMVINIWNSPETWVIQYANYFAIMQPGGFDAAGAVNAPSAQMTPADAFNIDNKIDDGKPLRGAVLAGINQSFSLIVGGPWIDACATAADTYNLDPTYVDTNICVMNVKM